MIGLAVLCVSSCAAATATVPYVLPAQLADQAEVLSPTEIKFEGFLGQRVANNAVNRLAKVDLEPLLAGFRKKPGSHPWIGEHIGKWMQRGNAGVAYTKRGRAARETGLRGG